MFWTDWDRHGPKIEAANMDGTDRQVIEKIFSFVMINQSFFFRLWLTVDSGNQTH